MILTLDLGTTRTKAAVWGDEGDVLGAGDATLTTQHPGPGRAEQDAAQWWPSVVSACAAARNAAGRGAFASVEAVGFAAARQTFVPVTAGGEPLGPALLWSDQRGGGTVTGKLEWLRAHEPARVAAARWALAPRDLVVWRLTGVVATDTTLASAGGIAGPCALQPVAVEPLAVVGPVLPGPAEELGLPPSTPVVIGAGDRPCEVLATAASDGRPMVSWGTTANVSFPVVSAVASPHLLLTRGALGGWLLEGGLAAAGSLLAWVSGLTGVGVEALASAAAASPPGARGVTCLPWLGGARAPWWSPSATAGFLGLGPSHGPGDLARAAFEAVAFDIARCIELAGVAPSGLALAGGATLSPWAEIVTAVAGVPGAVRASREAASVGALLLVARALGRPADVEAVNPVTGVVCPSPSDVAAYEEPRAVSDAAVAAALSLAGVTS